MCSCTLTLRCYAVNSYRKFSIPISVQDDRKIKKYQDTYTVSHAVLYSVAITILTAYLVSHVHT